MSTIKSKEKQKTGKDSKSPKQDSSLISEGQSSSTLSPKRKGTADQDVETVLKQFWNQYSKITDTHTKMIDLFILYLLVLIGCQIFYRLVVGDDFPRNAFVSGTFCPLGVLVLLVILRGGARDLKQLAEFFLACLVLFITAINFAG
jgi:hypothetical protein